MNADDGIAIAELDAGADHTVDLLLHLRVAALYRVEVELLDVLALDHAGRGAATHADPVGGPADLHDPHLLLGAVLLDVPRVDLADAAGEHDRLDPLAPLAVGEPQPERARVSLDDRLAELVAVVRGPVRCLDLDLERRGEVARISESRVFPGKLVAGDTQVAHAVGGGPSDDQRAATCGVHVADAAAGARLGARERRHARREVVGLGREDDVVVQVRGHERARHAGARGDDRSDRVAADRAGVVLEGDDAVVGVRLQRLFDQRDQMLGDLLTIDHQPTLEEPVPRVLAVRLGDVEALHVGGVATDPVQEEVGIVVEIPVVEGEPHLSVDPLEGRPALLHDRDLVYRFRLRSRLEALQRLRVRGLRHPVVDIRQKSPSLFLAQPRDPPQQVAARTLDTPNLLQTTGVTDGDRVRGPGGGEVHPRAHLQQDALRAQKALSPEALRLEGLGQQPGEDPELLSGEFPGGVDVEAVFRLEAVNVR